MRSNEFMMALNALCHEKEISKEVVLDAIETALQTAYRRDFDHEPNVSVEMNRTTGDARVYVEWRVVETVENESAEMTVEEARKKYGAQVSEGEVVREERTPQNFGRIAAQTAKQVILQRIREAERDKTFSEFRERENEILMGVVQSVDSKTGAVRLSLGKAEAVLPRSEQLPGEKYRVGQRVRGYVAEVSKGNKGPQITLSRTHRQMLRRLMELEVPEIANGTVEIRAIAREPGARSKVAVAALQAGIDPVGACVGMKGTRIQSIVNELNNEKIDVVQWSPDVATYISNSLSPAKVMDAFLEEGNEEGKTAIVVVPDKQLSLAIGKEGQNARLAAKLTGWRIDIKSASEAAEERVRLAEREARRREEEGRRRAEEETRLAAARALLAEAEAAASEMDEEELSPISEADLIAYGGTAVAEPAEADAAPLTEQPRPAGAQPVQPIQPVQPVAPVQPPAAAQPTAQPAPTQPGPSAQPRAEPKAEPAVAQPKPQPAPQPRPQPVVEQPLEDFEEEEDEDETPLPAKSKTPMIFYTLNERGEAESLDDTVERQRQQKKKKKGKTKGAREEKRDERFTPPEAARKDQGKSRRSRRPWSPDDNW